MTIHNGQRPRVHHAPIECTAVSIPRGPGSSELPDQNGPEMPPYTPLEDRLWPKIDASGDCWQWLGPHGRDGYPRMGSGPAGSLVYRNVWHVLVGPIPAGLDIDHLCRNRGCVNPDHLEPVPHRINISRGYSPTAFNTRKTLCDNGHDLTDPANLYARANARRCRQCFSDRVAANREAINARRAARYAANREAILAARRAKRAANREAINARNAARYAANREAILAARRAKRAAQKVAAG